MRRSLPRSRKHQRFDLFTDRSLLVAFSDVERVLEDGVHDPADAEGRLDDVGDDLLHCRWGEEEREEEEEELNHFPTFPEMFSPK